VYIIHAVWSALCGEVGIDLSKWERGRRRKAAAYCEPHARAPSTHETFIKRSLYRLHLTLYSRDRAR
jgi:hypothetical protein